MLCEGQVDKIMEKKKTPYLKSNDILFTLKQFLLTNTQRNSKEYGGKKWSCSIRLKTVVCT